MNKLFTLITLLWLYLQGSAVFGQEWQWVKKAGGKGTDWVTSIGVDAAGNSYITGAFEDTIHFGDLILKNRVNDIYKIYYDIFLTKYDTDGQEVWTRQAGGGNSEWGRAIAVDPAGNSYLTGSLEGKAVFGNINLPDKGFGTYLAKYDTNGKVLWATNTSSTLAEGYGIAVDNQGNSYVTGWFQERIAFGSIILTGPELIEKPFLAKYNPSGEVVWAKTFSGEGIGLSNDVAVDAQGNSYITGYFDGKVSFGTKPLQAIGNSDAFLVKYDPSGNVIWARQASTSSGPYAMGEAIALDKTGNCYLTGLFVNELTLNDLILNGSGQEDVFIAKYDANGKVIWATKTGGAGADIGKSITVDATGQVTIAGSFNQLVQVGATTLNSVQDEDIFLAHYNANGEPVWALQAGGLNVDGLYLDLAQDGQGNSYLTGAFDETVDFGAKEITAIGSPDLFITKARPPAAATMNLSSLPTTSICAGSTIAIPFTTTGYWAEGTSFLVELSDASGSFVAPIVIGTGPTSPIEANIPLEIIAGSGYRMRIIASTGLMSADNGLDLTITALPEVSAGADETVCASASSFSLSGFSPAGGTWSGTGVNAPGVFTPALAQVGTHTLTYSVQKGACSFSSTKTITVVVPTSIMAAIVPTECSSVSTTQAYAPFQATFTNQTKGATGFLWDFGDGNTSNEEAPTHAYTQEGKYKVTLTALFGNECSQTKEITEVVIRKKQDLPNVFTPNRDGLNDTFAFNITCLSVNLKVFNRSGTLVYEQANYQNTWDGGSLSDGIYYYQLTTTKGSSWKGWVEIIR
ncbi:SBBP repeat-containing protein [Adhaeribacter pallidiroseus]|uniref:Microbial collagenase n=1 Tax=Adhaeribacter pallidiroseus TaxID=2072847 RepID=A0A369QMY7_9BACT|nr:SBBP repeat-containing protein [Adhaeribacter pallidiroseus]RDC64627.1 Microbial collagenase [Adhaeribacter pallidiroseus]